MAAVTTTTTSDGGLVEQLDTVLASPEGGELRDSVSARTWRAYRSDIATFEKWCRSRRRVWTTPATVAAYLRDLESAGASYATIERRKTAIAKLVDAQQILEGDELADPTKHATVSEVFKAIRARHPESGNEAEPLTAGPLVKVLATIDTGTLTGQRDTALLLVGFYGALRRSELAHIRRPHLRFDTNGVIIDLTTQPDKALQVGIHRQPTSRWDPVDVLERWLTELDNHLDTEVVWPRLSRAHNIYGDGPPISGDAINQIVARRTTTAGLQEHGYSAQSLRAGFTAETQQQGIDPTLVTAHTRRTPNRTTEPKALWANNPTTLRL